MGTAPTNLTSQSFSTRGLPIQDRVPYWRDYFVRKVLLADVEHLSVMPLEAEVSLVALPGLQAGWFNIPTTMSCQRTAAMAADSADGVSFFIKRTGLWTMDQRGRFVSLADGEAVGALSCEPSKKKVSHLDFIRVFVPRARLAPLVGDIESVMLRAVPADNEALRLLRRYLGVMRTEADGMSPELLQLQATHLLDLTAMALGATRDGAALAAGRGLRAARLHAVKCDILENLASADLTVTAVAVRQGVSPRYIQLLFEGEGHSFSGYVIGQRLTRAHKMLSDPRFAEVNVSTIAFDSGFGDLSYFNRSFRRYFGATPSDVRRAFASQVLDLRDAAESDRPVPPAGRNPGSPPDRD